MARPDVRLELYLRSGQVVVVDAVDWKFEGGMLPTLTWTPIAEGRRLVHVSLEDVAAIVEVSGG